MRKKLGSHTNGASTDARDRTARVFAQEAETRAQGLKFRIYPNSSLNIKPRETLDALQNDKLEMAVYPLVYAVSKVPEFSLAGLPGIVPDLAASQALKSSEIFAMLQSIAEDNGIRLLALLWNPGGFLAKSREISEPKSVAGLRMRVSDPLFGLMLKQAGASVTTMPSNEIYAGMQSGSLDAVVTTYETILSRKIYRASKIRHRRQPLSVHGVLSPGDVAGRLEATDAGTTDGGGGGGGDSRYLLRVRRSAMSSAGW